MPTLSHNHRTKNFHSMVCKDGRLGKTCDWCCEEWQTQIFPKTLWKTIYQLACKHKRLVHFTSNLAWAQNSGLHLWRLWKSYGWRKRCSCMFKMRKSQYCSRSRCSWYMVLICSLAFLNSWISKSNKRPENLLSNKHTCHGLWHYCFLGFKNGFLGAWIYGRYSFWTLRYQRLGSWRNWQKDEQVLGQWCWSNWTHWKIWCRCTSHVTCPWNEHGRRCQIHRKQGGKFQNIY